MVYTFLNDKKTPWRALPSCRRRNPGARIQNPEKASMTPKRHAVRGRGFSPGGCSGGCYLALSDRAVRTAEPAAGRSR